MICLINSCNQLLHIVELGVDVGDQQRWVGRDRADVVKVVVHIEGQLFKARGCHAQAAAGDEQQVVAICLAAFEFSNRVLSVGTGLVFNDDGGAQLFADAVGHKACGRVGGAASGKAHDHANGFAGPYVLRHGHAGG